MYDTSLCYRVDMEGKPGSGEKSILFHPNG